MEMTTGDTIALGAVGLNALVYLSGAFKLSGTVANLKELVTKVESTLTNIDERLATTETSVKVIENNCSLLHGGRKP